MKIIAECGVNWSDLDQACEMIEKSKESGCDYAKFQLYDSETIKDHPLRDELTKLMLSRDDAQALVDFGESIGQPVFFTPMFLDAIDWIADMKRPFVKIRYADRYNTELVDRALDVGVPVLLSADHHYVAYYRNPQIKLLYCVPDYPASPGDYSVLPEDFTTGTYPGAPVFAGVSDHTKGLEIMVRSFWCGADFCECHVMIKGTHPIEERWSKTFEDVRIFLQQM